MDQMIQNAPFYDEDKPLVTSDKWNLKFVFQQQFTTVDKIKQFLQAMGTTSPVENPFPGRSILLKDVHCSIRSPAVGQCMENILPLARNIFMYLINLKTLVINGFLMLEDGGFSSASMDLYTTPFPTLENLETLDVWKTSANFMVNAILRASKNLKRLSISKHSFDANIELPKLEFVRLGINEMSDFQTLKNLKCPLKMLDVEYGGNSRRLCLSLVHWFKGLEPFAKTVECVNLTVGIATAKLENAMVNLDFPRLEELHIEEYSDSSLSCIPTLRALKKLYITSMEPEDSDCIRDELADKCHEIWERLPKLQIIEHIDSDDMFDGEWPEITVAKRGFGVVDIDSDMDTD